jgi:hypothetical protein
MSLVLMIVPTVLPESPEFRSVAFRRSSIIPSCSALQAQNSLYYSYCTRWNVWWNSLLRKVVCFQESRGFLGHAAVNEDFP